MAVTFVVPGAHLMSGLLGERDEHLRFIEGEFEDVAIRVRGNEVSIDGPQSDVVSRLFEELTALLQRGESLDRSVLSRSIVMVQANTLKPLGTMSLRLVLVQRVREKVGLQ